MEPKKNLNVDPKRNSSLYFQLGLAAIAILSYLAIELKTYEKDLSGLTKEVDNSFLDEDVPVTMQLNTPPPPPPPPPPVLLGETVMVTLADVCSLPSFAVKLNTNCVVLVTVGAVKLAFSDCAPFNVTDVPAVCCHK